MSKNQQPPRSRAPKATRVAPAAQVARAASVERLAGGATGSTAGPDELLAEFFVPGVSQGVSNTPGNSGKQEPQESPNIVNTVQQRAGRWPMLLRAVTEQSRILLREYREMGQLTQAEAAERFVELMKRVNDGGWGWGMNGAALSRLELSADRVGRTNLRTLLTLLEVYRVRLTDWAAAVELAAMTGEFGGTPYAQEVQQGIALETRLLRALRTMPMSSRRRITAVVEALALMDEETASAAGLSAVALAGVEPDGQPSVDARRLAQALSDTVREVDQWASAGAEAAQTSQSAPSRPTPPPSGRPRRRAANT